MKVLGINGSGGKDGNAAILTRTIFVELEAGGIETEFLQLCNKRIEIGFYWFIQHDAALP